MPGSATRTRARRKSAGPRWRRPRESVKVPGSEAVRFNRAPLDARRRPGAQGAPGLLLSSAAEILVVPLDRALPGRIGGGFVVARGRGVVVEAVAGSGI